MDYKKIDMNIYYGTIDANIRDVIKNYPEFFHLFNGVITCLDSAPKPGTYYKLEDNILKDIKYTIANGDIWIEKKSIISSLDRLMCNYSEIYLLPEKPDVDIQIGDVFTAERAQFIEEIPKEFLRVFKELSAIRYLSDGYGLNFVCESETIAQKLIEIQ